MLAYTMTLKDRWTLDFEDETERRYTARLNYGLYFHPATLHVELLEDMGRRWSGRRHGPLHRAAAGAHRRGQEAALRWCEGRWLRPLSPLVTVEYGLYYLSGNDIRPAQRRAEHAATKC